MTKSLNHFIIILLSSMTTLALAVPPKQLITHNNTDVESNAFVAGTIPSRHPTKAHSDSKVIWTEVRMACFGHVTNNKCMALIKMETGLGDSGNPIDLGMVSMDLNTGIITPSSLTANGYTMIVNGPGETTLFKN